MKVVELKRGISASHDAGGVDGAGSTGATTGILNKGGSGGAWAEGTFLPSLDRAKNF